MFMILGKSFRQISFLQVFHHATIGMVWGLVLDSGWGSGTVAWGAYINSVTHVLLYTHYFVTSLGFQNPLKKALFSFQQAQVSETNIFIFFLSKNRADVDLVPLSLLHVRCLVFPVIFFSLFLLPAVLVVHCPCGSRLWWSRVGNRTCVSTSFVMASSNVSSSHVVFIFNAAVLGTKLVGW